ncbi:MAG: hypothetical protein WCE75_06090 [Terracidiphilus sp.]
MQVFVEVTDEIVREAEKRELPVVDFVETLVARGLDVVMDRPAVMGAIERIRALRTATAASRG